MNKSNPFDTNVQTLPLGKAKSILELLVMDLPCDQSNGVYVAMDLISEAIEIASGFTDGKTIPEQKAKPGDTDHSNGDKEAYDPGPWEPPTAASTTTLLNEALGLVDHAKGLLSAHVADLAGEKEYFDYWNKGAAS